MRYKRYFMSQEELARIKRGDAIHNSEIKRGEAEREVYGDRPDTGMTPLAEVRRKPELTGEISAFGKIMR